MIYLDSAATSLQKPQSVSRAMLMAMRTAASTGRSAHGPAMRASEIVFDCRSALAGMFGLSEPDNVVFTMNATHGLNIAINALVTEGTRVLVSGYEHNSVMRPLYARRADIRIARSRLFDREDAVNAFAAGMDWAEVVICTHVSNVFGYILPIEEIARLCREHGRRLVIDASQSAGTLPLDISSLGADYIAMPGHKGLLGPQGTGVLLCAKACRPLIQGGSGSESMSPYMPEYLPDRLEGGTLNVTGIAGLLAGVEYITRLGAGRIFSHERRLTGILADSIASCGGIQVFKSADESAQTGVLSIVPVGRGCTECAEFLSGRGVAVRSGLHCAPEAHRTAGTLETGTVRLSVSPFTTESEVRRAGRLLCDFVKTGI